MSEDEQSLEPSSLVERIAQEQLAIGRRLRCKTSVDLIFVAFLRQVSRFGYFTLGPITVDVRLVEDLFERTAEPDEHYPGGVTAGYERFSKLLMQEVRRSGRARIDELHYLLAFMHCGEGLPARVFGELGVTREQIESHLRRSPADGGPAETTPLLTPEEVAEYLKVHVQTVRAWIRAGTLPARRIAGLRALRVRLSDVEKLLQPLDGSD